MNALHICCKFCKGTWALRWVDCVALWSQNLHWYFTFSCINSMWFLRPDFENDLLHWWHSNFIPLWTLFIWKFRFHVLLICFPHSGQFFITFEVSCVELLCLKKLVTMMHFVFFTHQIFCSLYLNEKYGFKTKPSR